MEESLLDLVTVSLDKDKADNIVVIDLAKKSTISDHMIIASGNSNRQVIAMAGHILKKLKTKAISKVNVEGLATGDWVLIDAGDLIIHLFRPEVRQFYGLEKMWGVEVAKTHGPKDVRSSKRTKI